MGWPCSKESEKSRRLEARQTFLFSTQGICGRLAQAHSVTILPSRKSQLFPVPKECSRSVHCKASYNIFILGKRRAMKRCQDSSLCAFVLSFRCACACARACARVCVCVKWLASSHLKRISSYFHFLMNRSSLLKKLFLWKAFNLNQNGFDA